MAYVYRHIRIDKNEPFYIGIGCDSGGLYKRAYDFYSCRRSIVWNKIYNKTEISVDILVDEITYQQAQEKEVEFIKLYGRKDIGTGILTNKTDGGDALPGLVFTESHRKKLSDKAKSRPPQSEELRNRFIKARVGKSSWNKGISGSASHAYGIVRSDETKLKCSVSKQGAKNAMFGKTGASNPNMKGVIQMFKDGELLGEYEGLYDCQDKTGLRAKAVSRCVRGERNHHKGYTFKRILK